MSTSTLSNRISFPSLLADTSWQARTAALAVVLTIAHLIAAAGLGLTDTEAYYASWTRVLDWSYYDHPPLLAWLTSLAMHVVPGTLGIRLVPVASSLLFAILLARFTAAMFTPRAGFYALVVTTVMPAFVFIGFISNPEAPLAPLWIAALWILWEMRSRTSPWLPIALGAVVGVGFLAKYTAVLVVPIAFVWILSSARSWLKRPSLWIGALLALVVAMPVIVWNARHGWPSLALHLSERVATPSLATYGENAVRTLTGQIGLFQPLAIAGLLAMLGIAVRRRNDDPRFRLLALAGVSVLAFFFVMMVRVRDAEPHWTMTGWMPAAIAAGAWLDEGQRQSSLSRAMRIFSGGAIAVGLTMLAVSVVHATTTMIPMDERSDPMGETVGWDKVRAAILTHATELGPTTVVAASHNVFCGRLALELGDHPNVYCPSPRRTEFDFTGRRDVPPNVPILFVESIRYPDPKVALPDHACKPLETLSIERGGRVVNRYRFHACR